MNQTFHFYKVTNTKNNKIYIGYTGKLHPSERWKEHRGAARRGVGYLFYDAIRKYGENAFVFEVIAGYKGQIKEVEKIECELIRQYQSAHNQWGYNLKLLDERPSIKRNPLTEKQKKHISETTKIAMNNPFVRQQLVESHKAFYANGGIHPMTGKTHSHESIQKMSETHSKMSKETKSKIGEASKLSWQNPNHIERRMKAAKRSSETRQKMSAAKKGKPSWNTGKPNTWTAAARSKTYIVTTPTGEELTVTNLRKFAIKNGLSQGTLHMTSTGARSFHKGFKCRLIN